MSGGRGFTIGTGDAVVKAGVAAVSVEKGAQDVRILVFREAGRAIIVLTD